MNSRERIQATINHHEPDRVCVDFGSSAVTGMHVLIIERLREKLGLEKRPVKVNEPYQMLGEIEEDLLDRLGIDTTGLPAPETIFGFRNSGWRPWTTPWGQEVLVSEYFQTMEDEKGDILIYPKGDRSAPPSGRMPVGGYFFDSIIRQEPIAEDALDPEDNLEEFGDLSDADIDHYRLKASELEDSSRAVVSGVPGTAFGDIALVPAPFLTHPKGIRDVSEWYMSTAMRQDYIHEVFDRQADIALRNLARINDVAGEAIDVVFLCGTDFGTQNSQFCSPETFDELWAPYYKRLNDWIHENAPWKTFKHCCGAIYPLMENFIACGFDIINPVQISAEGMDAKQLKLEFGDRVTFWGGGVDTQKTLPFGTPEAVYREVRERIDVFAPGGGFVFDAIHNVQANTPVENVMAMFKALEDARS